MRDIDKFTSLLDEVGQKYRRDEESVLCEDGIVLFIVQEDANGVPINDWYHCGILFDREGKFMGFEYGE